MAVGRRRGTRFPSAEPGLGPNSSPGAVTCLCQRASGGHKDRRGPDGGKTGGLLLVRLIINYEIVKEERGRKEN